MTAQIRTRPDGSIDTGHYIARAHTLRSRQAHDLTRRAAGRGLRATPVLALCTMLVLLVLPVLH